MSQRFFFATLLLYARDALAHIRGLAALAVWCVAEGYRETSGAQWTRVMAREGLRFWFTAK